MKRADRAIITSGFVVAASTAGLAAVRSYGTVMFQLVVLGAWSIVARLSSGIFADRHQGLVWLVALAVNITAFSLIGIPGCFLEIVCRSGGHSSCGRWERLGVAFVRIFVVRRDMSIASRRQKS